jgi:hypothetical protein
MKRPFVLTAIFGTVLLSHLALAQPSAIPQIGQSPHSAIETFALIKNYFSSNGGANLTKFRGISSIFTTINSETNTITAEIAIGNESTWAKVASCNTNPSRPTDSFEYGKVSLQISVESVGPNSSKVRLSANFEDTYRGVDSLPTKQECTSSGVLEQKILTSANSSQSVDTNVVNQ